MSESRGSTWERERRTDAVDLQPHLTGAGPDALVEGEVDAVLPRLAVGQGLELAQVDRAGPGRVVLLVSLGEGVRIGAREAAPGLLAVLGEHGRLEVVAPGAGGIGETALEVGYVDLVDVPARLGADHEMQACRERLAHVRGVLDRLGVELLAQDPGQSLAHGGVVAIARQVDQARDEAAVDVAADEESQLPAFADVHHLRGDRHQLVDRRLEELVARIGLEDIHQGLAGMTHRLEAGLGQDGLRLLAQ